MSFLEEIKNCEVFFEKSLKEFCTFKIGGKAKYVLIAKSIEALIQGYVACKIHNIKRKVVGFGSNLLFSDSGYNGAIIVNKASKIFKRKNCLYIDSGTPFSAVINFAFFHSLGGIETLIGIPATMGGAVVNNMGAFGVSVSEFVEYVEGYYPYAPTKKVRIKNKILASKKEANNQNKRARKNVQDCTFSYRDSIFKHIDFVITRVKLKLEIANKSAIRQNMKEALNKKSATQPLNYPSAGSVFKRCEIIPAKVIDELNLKGAKIGGAEISKKHAGFIINKNEAKAIDVLALITLINDKVYEKFKTKFELEIEYVD